MTARPGNWSLIADGGSDPVPGDPDAVRVQASYYASMAESIRTEANRLKTLGEAGTLVGKYSEALKKELGELSEDVMQAHGRYEAVGTALKPYAHALDEARAESWGALHDADTAHASQGSAGNMPNPQATDGKPLTAAQKVQQSSRATAISEANNALERAKTRLSNALGELNTAGKRAADAINDGSNDSLKDHHHWWDVVVKIIKVIVEILNYVVIALVIISLFIPGLDLVTAIFLISAAIFVADTALAATGNGSWMDVAIDFVSLCTLGAGGALEKAGARGAEAAVKSATKAAIKTEFRSSGNIIMRNLVGRSGKMAAAKVLGEAKVSAFVKTFVKTADEGLTVKQALMSGSRKLAVSSKLESLLGTEFGGSSILRSTYMSGLRGAGRTVWGLGVAGPLGNMAFSKSNLPGIMGDKPYSQTWENTKESVLPHFHLPLVASEYNWNDHPVMSAAVSGAIYGPANLTPNIGG